MLGSAHPGAFAFAQSLENLLSLMRAELSMKKGGKAAARRKERTASSLLSPTALAEIDCGGGDKGGDGGDRAACDARARGGSSGLGKGLGDSEGQ